MSGRSARCVVRGPGTAKCGYRAMTQRQRRALRIRHRRLIPSAWISSQISPVTPSTGSTCNTTRDCAEMPRPPGQTPESRTHILAADPQYRPISQRQIAAAHTWHAHGPEDPAACLAYALAAVAGSAGSSPNHTSTGIEAFLERNRNHMKTPATTRMIAMISDVSLKAST